MTHPQRWSAVIRGSITTRCSLRLAVSYQMWGWGRMPQFHGERLARFLTWGI